MLQLIFFQSALLSFKALLYILDTCVIFLGLFHSAFISFHSAFIFWQRAFVQVFLSAGKRFIIALSLNFF
jgi:hypothetical protein